MTVWEAHPFDEIIDFSAYAPGEVVDIFDGKLVVRTVDGSLLIDRYECGREIEEEIFWSKKLYEDSGSNG